MARPVRSAAAVPDRATRCWSPIYASAELGCFQALGWPKPTNILDLFTEFRARTNGLTGGAGLIAAATYFGIDGIGAHRQSTTCAPLILAGGPWSADDRAMQSCDYCESDVLRWSDCCRPCCRASTCRALCCAAGS